MAREIGGGVTPAGSLRSDQPIRTRRAHDAPENSAEPGDDTQQDRIEDLGRYANTVVNMSLNKAVICVMPSAFNF
jgi:hypothetical protein